MQIITTTIIIIIIIIIIIKMEVGDRKDAVEQLT